jgi:RNA polymerase sigma-70 factor, ECF subfamily
MLSAFFRFFPQKIRTLLVLLMSFFMQPMVGEAILEKAQAAKAETPLESVESLVAAYSLMAFRIAYSILRNHHDAEDAVQECFLRVLKHRNRLSAVRNPVRNSKTWVARVAWTAALDRRSGRARIAAHEDASQGELLLELSGGDPSVEERLARKQLQGLMEQMIATLPKELRHPLELSTVRELNSAEIAEILGIPEGSVRTRLMRARQRLKEKLSAVLEVKHV